MPIVDSAGIDPAAPASFLSYQVYNGLDCCITTEVREKLEAEFAARPQAVRVYSFARALEAPYLEMMRRGFRVNLAARSREFTACTRRITYLKQILYEMAMASWGKGLNPGSPKELRDFFYGELGLPPQILWAGKKRHVATNREALENLDAYPSAAAIVHTILAIRDATKEQQMLATPLDAQGRFRTSYNIAGTRSGRLSSSSSAFGIGGNLMNPKKSLKHIFEADEGMRLCNIDLAQTEARDVGWLCGVLFGDWGYLDACESGDVHTRNASLVWPELPWNGDRKHDRAIADQHFYRDYSYRDMAKRGSHLSNYSGTAKTMSRSLKIPVSLATEFQARYCNPVLAEKLGCHCAYPVISRWWQWVAEQIQAKHFLETPFGFRQYFFGRTDESSTIREAISFIPQSMTANRMNLGLWRVWRWMPQVQLLAQTYDSITFQYSEALDENAVVEEALSRIRVELATPGRAPYVVPGDAEVGWNWGHESSTNPNGLRSWRQGVRDDRHRI
jgi:DNA polymerase I-like protein with 3'-5' exonuclease and polymerase domains